MDITCKNCGQKYIGHYCNNCGQPAATHQLNFHFLWKEIQHDLLHFNEGIPYSAKQLFTRPGHSIREFIEGKRVRHMKPISLVLLLAALYGFLYHYFDISFNDVSKNYSSENGIDNVKLNDWVGSHYPWVMLFTIPLYTIGTCIAFKKQGYNVVEYLILNTYKASQRLLVHIALFPVLYYYNGTHTMQTLSIIIYLLDLVLIFWTNRQFFNKLSIKKILILTLLSQILFLISLITIILISVLVYPSFS